MGDFFMLEEKKQEIIDNSDLAVEKTSNKEIIDENKKYKQSNVNLQ